MIPVTPVTRCATFSELTNDIDAHQIIEEITLETTPEEFDALCTLHPTYQLNQEVELEIEEGGESIRLNALMVSVGVKNYFLIERICEIGGKEILDLGNSQGITPLIIAAMLSDELAVIKLTNLGANVNIATTQSFKCRDSNYLSAGTTALWIAVENENNHVNGFAVAKFLLLNGAVAESEVALSDHGIRILEGLQRELNDALPIPKRPLQGKIFTPIILGQMPVLECATLAESDFVFDGPADELVNPASIVIKQIGKHTTPEVFEAIRVKYPTYELTQGEPCNNATALIQAASVGNVCLAEYLVRKEGSLLELGDRYGRTPLFWAAYRGMRVTATKLLELGAYVNVSTLCENCLDENLSGFMPKATPLSAAVQKTKNLVLIKTLLRNGAVTGPISGTQELLEQAKKEIQEERDLAVVVATVHRFPSGVTQIIADYVTYDFQRTNVFPMSLEKRSQYVNMKRDCRVKEIIPSQQILPHASSSASKLEKLEKCLLM